MPLYGWCGWTGDTLINGPIPKCTRYKKIVNTKPLREVKLSGENPKYKIYLTWLEIEDETLKFWKSTIPKVKPHCG